MASSAPQARVREQPMGEEEATTELKLGAFQHVPALSLSEALLVMRVVADSHKARGDFRETEIFAKTNDYLDHFARFKRKENIEAVERILLAHPQLESFERAQLGSLCCETAEEAKTLVPSLAEKISDADLQEALDEVTKLRNFVES
ncbi:MAG: hypothetical protein M1823_002661 [Watsoniomyces obsoletus]|nr:MAG: hypothetical protein M1823_002661 [Watsoniomyces obsoletus]